MFVKEVWGERGASGAKRQKNGAFKGQNLDISAHSPSEKTIFALKLLFSLPPYHFKSQWLKT